MGFNRLDLNLLRIFHAILHIRSVTIADTNLHLTLPAVKKQLNRLRELATSVRSAASTYNSEIGSHQMP
jgi:hypothetical protein